MFEVLTTNPGWLKTFRASILISIETRSLILLSLNIAASMLEEWEGR